MRYGGSCKLNSRAAPERLYISKLHAESHVRSCCAVQEQRDPMHLRIVCAFPSALQCCSCGVTGFPLLLN